MMSQSWSMRGVSGSREKCSMWLAIPTSAVRRSIAITRFRRTLD
jgi:hypothetical protein